MRILSILVIGILLAPAAQASGMRHDVNLDTPGALESIMHARPDHYRRIVGILRAAQVVPCDTLPGFLKVEFQSASSYCHGSLLLTSLPAKRHLWFVLDDTRYTTNMVQLGVTAHVIPLR